MGTPESKDEIIDNQKKQIDDLLNRLKDPKLGVEGLDGLLSAFKDMPELKNMEKVAEQLKQFAVNMGPVLEAVKKLSPEQVAQVKKDVSK